MVVDMELQEAKDYVLELMKDKNKIEEELKAQKQILDVNNIGMDESLVDSEGYPRQDVDVYQVRHARHRIICLRNDHKALMVKIEEGLHKVHALAANQEQSSVPATSGPSGSTTSIQEPITLGPFLRVNLVSPGSPADLAGIKLDDQILQFGSIDYRNFKSLKDIGGLVENSRYKTLDVTVKRGSDVMTLSLIPRPWAGKGLLGCNIIPIEIVER